MALQLTTGSSGQPIQELGWPTSYNAWVDFVGRWGLQPDTAVRALALGYYASHILGLSLFIISGRRSSGEQAALWNQRGSRALPVAPPGSSLHETGQAFDVGASRTLTDSEWDAVGGLGRALGLTWGGTFRTPDRPHFQYGG